MSLKYTNSVYKNSMAYFRATLFGVEHHLRKKIPIFIEDKWWEQANPEEEEAHTQIENSVKILSSPNFPNKSVVWDYRKDDQHPFQYINKKHDLPGFGGSNYC